MKWEDTRTVHIMGLSAQVHDHGYERMGEIVSVNVTSQRTKTRNTGGKSRWEWSGQGNCGVVVKSFAEATPA
jgi:hypothetical protein